MTASTALLRYQRQVEADRRHHVANVAALEAGDGFEDLSAADRVRLLELNRRCLAEAMSGSATYAADPGAA